MRAILVDDEMGSCQLLQYELDKLDIPIEILGLFDDSRKALESIKLLKPDILFLDIEMPHLNGFALLDSLGAMIESMNIVFVTAYHEYAIKAFKYFAVDYLLKPVDSKLLQQSLDTIITRRRQLNKEDLNALQGLIQQQGDKPHKLVLPLSTGYQVVKINEILRCESSSNYTHIHLLNNENILVSKPLKYYDDILSEHGFRRVHQSHLVNPEYIVKYDNRDGGYLVLSDNSIVSVSRSHKKDILNILRNI